MFGKIDERKIKEMWDLLCVGASKEDAKSILSAEDFALFLLMFDEFDNYLGGEPSHDIKQ